MLGLEPGGFLGPLPRQAGLSNDISRGAPGHVWQAQALQFCALKLNFDAGHFQLSGSPCQHWEEDGPGTRPEEDSPS